MLDYVCAFAGSVADEEAWALLQVFGEAVFVDDGWGGFRELAGEIPGRARDDGRGAGDCRGAGSLKHSGVDFHTTGVDHRDDEAGVPGRAGDDVGRGDVPGRAGDDVRGAGDDVGRLGDEGVEGADGEEGFAGAEAEAFGCGYSHSEACV